MVFFFLLFLSCVQIWLTPQFRTVSVRFEVFFFFKIPYIIRLLATITNKIYFWSRLLIFDESAAAFDFTVPFEPYMCGLDCRNSTSPRIYPAFDSGGGNEVFLNCRMRCNYAHRWRTRFRFYSYGDTILLVSYSQKMIRRQNCRMEFLCVKKIVEHSAASDMS